MDAIKVVCLHIYAYQVHAKIIKRRCLFYINSACSVYNYYTNAAEAMPPRSVAASYDHE